MFVCIYVCLYTTLLEIMTLSLSIFSYMTVCPDLDIVNGMVATTGDTPGSTATYTCNSGFTLNGDTDRTCQENLTWTGSNPFCEGEE